jgi:hypothetical protein
MRINKGNEKISHHRHADCSRYSPPIKFWRHPDKRLKQPLANNGSVNSATVCTATFVTWDSRVIIEDVTMSLVTQVKHLPNFKCLLQNTRKKTSLTIWDSQANTTLPRESMKVYFKVICFKFLRIFSNTWYFEIANLESYFKRVTGKSGRE